MSTSNQKNNTTVPEVKNGFQIPKWAGKPPNGLHLDVIKESKMIQKLMIDEKNCYFFGRNKDTVDFLTDHASCSRVHAVLLWHKHLNRSFIIDLGSAHGTFIGSIRLEHNKPQQVFIDSELKFGASSRTYIIRERPQMNKHFPSMLLASNNTSLNDSIAKEDSEDFHNTSIAASLPESEAELDNLTEFNTAHNKRIAQLVDNNSNIASGSIGPAIVKRKKKLVSFCEDEDVINPEDIDPTVGRFRNMIQTTVFIPNKKKRINQNQISSQVDLLNKRSKTEDDENNETKEEDDQHNKGIEEEEDVEDEDQLNDEEEEIQISTITSSLGIKTLNLAPDIDNEEYNTESNETIIQRQQLIYQQQLHQQHIQMINRQTQHAVQLQQEHAQQQQQQQLDQASTDLARKKIYAKEAWPGRKTPLLPPSQLPQELSISVAHLNTTSQKASPGVKASLAKLPAVSPNKSTVTVPVQPTVATKRLII